MADYFANHVEVIAAARTADEKVLMAYCMLLRVVEQQAAKHPEWVVVRHEDLCAAPLAGFDAMFSRLGMTFTSEAMEFVERSSGVDDGKTYGLFRDSAQAAESWRRELPEHLVRRAAQTCAALGIASY